ncbi:MAG TPA: carbonic anhydrase family protein, partial [Burkholderiaceae bacterium]|nr:carbonic anhydrase family protein [Burkholderiaceae bacterium]
AADRCTDGRRQSPIAIEHTTPRALPALGFDYHPSQPVLAHDGHTLRVRVAKGSALVVGGERYALQQVHFHTPGGDRVGGETFPLSAHLLHKGPKGQLLAVALMFRLGQPHPLLDRLFNLIPAPGVSVAGEGVPQVNPADLLPAQRGYYRYVGSETAPPCTEGVDWIVLRQPVEVSAAQLALWKGRFADNMRAAQPQNGRPVLESLP